MLKTNFLFKFILYVYLLVRNGFFVEKRYFSLMIKSRLFAVFTALSAAEKAGLRKFVCSPYHNAREDVIELFDFLIHNYRNPEMLEKELAFKAIFPLASTYDDFKLRQAMTFLLRLIEKFLILEQSKQHKIDEKIKLAEIYRKKNLHKLFKNTLSNAEKLLTKHPLRNVDFHETEYRIQAEYYAVSSIEKRVAPLNLQRMNDLLDIRFIAEKLRRACLTFAHKNVFNSDYKIELLPEIEALIHHKKLLRIPIVAIYFYTYKSMTSDDPYYFQQKKNCLFKHSNLFAKEELRDLFLLAINYCIKRINNNEIAFIQESFDLYQTGLKYEVFSQNGYLSRFTYKNMVSIGLKLGEYQVIEQFIHQYKDQLDPKYREGNYRYNLALLYYSRKEYQAAMQLLIQVDYDDLFLNLDSKNMLMKMYYELKEFDALESLLGSMQNYLLRKKVIGYHKTNYKNIIRLTKKLLKVKPFSKSEKSKLSLEIEQSQPLTERKWLMEQLKLL